MSLTQTPPTNRVQSIIHRTRQFWLRLIEPHASVNENREFRRAQLLSILTLILSVLFVSAFFSRPRSVGVFLALAGITVISYVLSRTKYYRLGTYLITYVFTAIGYLRIYQGAARSIESSVFSTVLIAIVFSSALLSQRGFLGLVFLSTIAAFASPLYSKVPVLETESIPLIGGVVLVIGTLLFGIQLFRANLDQEQLKNLSDSNRELEELTTTLEQRIRSRTTDLEEANKKVLERAARFQIVSDISQEISSNADQQPKELLNRIARSISEKLGFYHVGIFLVDDTREFAVLSATNSPGGQRMLERRHQLKVGGTGIVGYVSQSGRTRIALDTGTDAVFFNNPDLPKTRSEMAVPLKYGADIIGVLDVQSTLQSAFNDEDANLLITLANQVAIVINNVLLIEKSERRFSPQKMRKRESLQENNISGYSYLADGTITNAIPTNNLFLDQVLASGESVVLSQPSKGKPAAFAVPVKFRDQVIGIIQIEASETNRRWTEDEVVMVQAISDRAAFALENARLFEETARRADQEETIAHVTSQIGASTDFNRILQTTIQELGQALGASRSYIQLGTNEQNEKETGKNNSLARHIVTKRLA